MCENFDVIGIFVVQKLEISIKKMKQQVVEYGLMKNIKIMDMEQRLLVLEINIVLMF